MSRINKSIFILFYYKRRNCNICIGFYPFVDTGFLNIKVQRVWQRQKQQVNLTWNPVATYHNNDCCSLVLLGSKVTPCQPTADALTLWAKRVKFSFTCAEIRSGWLKKVDGATCGGSLQRRERNYGSYWSQWHQWELKMTASFQTQLYALYIKTGKSNPIFSATILLFCPSFDHQHLQNAEVLF